MYPPVQVNQGLYHFKAHSHLSARSAMCEYVRWYIPASERLIDKLNKVVIILSLSFWFVKINNVFKLQIATV